MAGKAVVCPDSELQLTSDSTVDEKSDSLSTSTTVTSGGVASGGVCSHDLPVATGDRGGQTLHGTTDASMEEAAIDRLVSMAVQGDEDDEDDEEYLSASDGEGDDRKITEWGESLSDTDTVGESNSVHAHSKSGSSPLRDEEGSEKVHRDDNSEGMDRNACTATSGEGDSDHEAGGDIANEGDEVTSGDGEGGYDGEEDDNEGGKADESDPLESRDCEDKEEDAAAKEQELERKRQEMEDTLTEEERQSRLAEAVKVKTSGNEAFKSMVWTEAMDQYSQALELCPLKYVQQRSIMLSNRAACHMKEEDYDAAVKDCSKAIDLQPTYIKAINRRADAYEKLEKLDDALKDHQRIMELDRSQASSFHACMRLENEIKERNEKMKAEVFGKLKDLGNMVLRPFGLSTNNFQMQQDPNTGSYSMQFTQNPPTNGH